MAPQPHEQVGATGCALATFARDGTPLEAWFPRPQLTSEPRGSGTTRLTPDEVGAELGSAAIAVLRVETGRPDARWCLDCLLSSPCVHCGRGRDRHIGRALACPGGMGTIFKRRP